MNPVRFVLHLVTFADERACAADGQVVDIMLQRVRYKEHGILFIQFLFLTFAFHFVIVDTKVCPSIDVRNSPSNLTKITNCTIISGYLKINLIHRNETKERVFNYTFPELVEISHYLLLYEVSYLKNIGQLFPNLRVIRGLQLLSNYALVIYKMESLEKIALTNLLYVQRGNVFIEQCPKLCYVRTIDWKRIGFGKLSHDRKTEANVCQPCPAECGPGANCWNYHTCQKQRDHCHPECYGCTKSNSSEHCLSCKNYAEDGVCVEKCSNRTFVHENARKCLTYDECHKILNFTHWTHGRECVKKCPLGYTLAENKSDSKLDHRCRYCGFNCNEICEPPEMLETVQELEKIAKCNIINNTLSIRIREEMEKEFQKGYLDRIKEIRGQLIIARSPTLKSINFLKNLRKVHGSTTSNFTIYIYENPILEQLWNYTNDFKLEIVRGHLGIYNNPYLCFSEIEKFVQVTNLTKTENLEHMMNLNGNKNNCGVQLELNITKKIIHSTNVTFAWNPVNIQGEDPFYTIIYKKASGPKLTHLDSEDGCNALVDSKIVHDLNVTLTGLDPYTNYSYYFKILGIKFITKTQIAHFLTSTDDPSIPENFTAEATSDSSIRLAWKRSAQLNGNFSHYFITALLERDYLPTILERDYCTHPQTDAVIQPVEITTPAPPTTNTTDNCSCIPAEMNEEIRFFKQDLFTLCSHRDCNEFMYITDDDSSTYITTSEISKFKRSLPTKKWEKSYRIGSVDTTDFLVENLTHFAMYIFFLRGCNLNAATDEEKCSGVEMAFARTLRNSSSDTIAQLAVTSVDDYVLLEWGAPARPNSIVVAYEIELNRTDSQHFKLVHECTNRSEQSYRIVGLEPGNYAVRVKAVSLAGPGAFSHWSYFMVEHSSGLGATNIAFIVLSLVVVLFIGVAIVYYHYRKRSEFDRTHLIASINPDYAGPIYVEDEWELERGDIELIRTIGQGSFGLVYEGVIKSKNWVCAVKTVNEGASMSSRMEFLNEGSVMKASNSGHHVIKLLGIVSRGQPPYVVMELMERGDLKSYLRRCRGPSQNISVNEMYRMAAEIADGMAYLTAKKVVHRDLATRNCMVAGDRTVKIGDFGMARDVYETDYYRKDTVGLLPVRWMAPESLSDGVFTTDSDAWSYGIVLWEMATLAQQPYQGLSNEQVFHFVKNRGRLERPPECSDLLFEVMDACWMWRPNDRPTFPAIVDRFAEHVGEGFKLVAFCFSKQGTEHALNAGPRTFNPPAMVANEGNHWEEEVEEEDMFYDL